jgi:quercetin dioxygenase-like cupin family protein
VRALGSTELEQDFPSMKGYVLRAREITVGPGGQIGVHGHERRPGVAVMLEGEMTERRAPGARPQPLGPGEVALEAAGVVHWWRNETDAPAKAIVIDIVPNDLP